MRNYVIINGVNSLTIKGLAINELPPIVKAPMRVLQEEIDGRDGDIITDLGYGAYDKIMTIGLYDGYDINKIIAFFNKEGTIVFSDEADKYYNFKIIEQIDYERLIKFRTASITFHCQPFKYPLTETPVEITNEYVEAEGTDLTLTPTAEAPISIDLKGNTQQDSTTGKNKLHNTATSQTKNNVTFTINDDGTIKLNGTSNAITWLTVGSITLEAGTYTLSQGNTDNVTRLYSDMSGYTSNGVKTFTISETKTQNISINIPKNTTLNNFVIKPMIESGSSATDYEPYTNGASPNPDYPQEIHNVSGDNTIVVEGKNLFDKDHANIINAYFASSVDDKITSNNSHRTLYIKCQPSTTYTIQKSTKGGSLRFRVGTTREIPEANTQVYQVAGDNSHSSETITTDENAIYLVVWFYNTNSTISLDDMLATIQVEYGNQSSTYTPYVSQSQLISLGDIELCKIGNYQDYFYYTDKWYLHKEIGKVVLDGSENWNKTAIFYADVISPYGKSDEGGFSNYFKFNLSSSLENNEIAIAGNKYRLFLKSDVASTTDDFKTWLSTHNTSIYYPLDTPTDTEITDSTLISQLDNILNMNSYNGTTNISQENNDEPFIIKVKAMKQGSGTATITNSGNIYSKPTIDIEGTGIVDVYIGSNQIFSVNVDEEVIIDSTNLEAYKPDGTLANRNVTGNIANLKLPTGNSTIKVDGDIDKATITNYTRYL